MAKSPRYNSPRSAWLSVCPSLLLVATLLAATVAWERGAHAQDDGEASAPGAAVFPTGDRRFRQAIQRAALAVKEERYDEALRDLGAILTPDPSKAANDAALTQDFFMPSKEPGALSSLKTEAMRLLDLIPPKAAKQYELEHGAEAQLLLDQAMAAGDAEKLSEVLRRYYHTQAGFRAALVLASLHLEQGRPLSAAALLQRLVETPSARNVVEPDASVLFAAALWHGGQAARAQEVLLNLKKRQPSFNFAAAKGATFSSVKDALPWLEKIFGVPHTSASGVKLQWTMFRGGVDRNATTSFAEPVSLWRWRLPIVNDPRDERWIAETARNLSQQGLPSLPSIHPLALHDVVLMRGPDRLVAVDAASGKRIWEHPWDLSEAEKALKNATLAGNTAIRSKQLAQRVWDDAPQGQLSSDGEVVYVINELGDSPLYGISNPVVFDNQNRARRNPQAQSSVNRLLALSLSKQGSLLWESPGMAPNDPLHDAFYLGAPLPVNGQLYAIVEIKGEIALVALDARSGELKWKQQLAHGENASILANPLRRLAGATPSYADGVLVCPTAAGTIVAVDITTRRLLWGVQYARNGERMPARFGGNAFAARNVPRYADRWLDGTALIANGRVLVTPPDSSELLCLDLLTGKEAWSPKKRDDLLFVAGVHNNTVVVVGKGKIVGMNLTDGQNAWPELMIDTPSGRGVIEQGTYYQPTSTGNLLAIDIAKGEIVHKFHTNQPLGNVIAYRDDIISLSDSSLAAYPRVDRLEKQVNEALAKNSNDPWALARRGELLMHQQKFEQALVGLRKAAAQSTPDPIVNGLRVDAILTLLGQDYAKHRALSDEVAPLLNDPVAANRFHRIVAAGREQAGDRLGAFQAFLALEANSAPNDGDGAAGSGQLLDLDRTWRVRNDRWIAAHIAALYESAKDAERAAMEKLIAERAKRLADKSPRALRDFVGRFAFHPAAENAQLDLASYLIDSQNLLEAERLILPLTKASDQDIAARAVSLEALCLLRAERWFDAASQFEQLANKFGNREVQAGKTGQQFRDEQFAGFEAKQALQDLRRVFPRGKVEIEPDSRSNLRNLPGQNRVFSVTMLQADVDGESPPTLMYDPSQNQLRVRDSRGRDITVINLNRTDNKRFYSNVAGLYTARMSGHLLIVSTGNEVIALDLLRGSRDPGDVIAWRSDLVDVSDQGVYTMVQTRHVINPWASPRYISADSSNRPIGITSSITSQGLCFAKQRQLVCVDPLTGETLWSRNDIPPGSDLFGDEEYLFVSPHNSSEATVYRMADGAQLGTRKVAHFDNRWSISGRHVLSWSQGNAGLKLQLDDVWSQTNVWTEAAPSGSRACLCSPNEVAVLSLDGAFRIRSLTADKTLLTTKLEPIATLQQVDVLQSQRDWVVAVSVTATNPAKASAYQPAPGGMLRQLFTGRVYAFDRASGKSLWPTSAAISQMSLPLDQAVDQPVLLFLRNVNSIRAASSQKRFTEVLCLDRRTGAVVYEDHEVPNDSHAYELEAETDAPAVRVALPGKSVRIRFTDQPAPPEPPVQYDQAFTVAKGSGSVGSALFRLFTTPPPAPPTSPPEEEVDPFDN